MGSACLTACNMDRQHCPSADRCLTPPPPPHPLLSPLPTVHTFPWLMTSFISSAAVAKMLPAAARGGLQHACSAFSFTHDGGMGAFVWMHSISVVALDPVFGELRMANRISRRGGGGSSGGGGGLEHPWSCRKWLLATGGSRSFNAYRPDESIRRHCLGVDFAAIGREFAARPVGQPRRLDGFSWLAWSQLPARALADAVLGFNPIEHCAVGQLPEHLQVGTDRANEETLNKCFCSQGGGGGGGGGAGKANLRRPAPRGVC